MVIEKVNINEVTYIVEMSIKAFRTDVSVGGKEGDCPPNYDSVDWHKQMVNEGHLFKAVCDDKIVGAAILFPDEIRQSLYIGRIFVDMDYHKKGYGINLMKSIETYFSTIERIELDTPEWNIRTNSFYNKIGYKLVKTEDGFNFYRKERNI